MNNIILVDTSYLTFNKFYAIKRWYMFKYPDDENNKDDDYDWFTNKIFIEKFKDMYLKTVESLFTKEILHNSIIIFCLDTPHQKVWRTQIYNDYKKGRINKYNYENTMSYVYNILLPDIINNNNNYYSLYVADVEADDVIANSIEYIKNKYKLYNIYVVSNDNDLKQLGDINIYFINLNDKKHICIDKNEAKMILKEKLLYGDKSDNIKSIFKIGYKINNHNIKKKDLLDDSILESYLCLNEDARQRYNLNNILIDLNNLPNKYKKQILDKLNIIFI